jgi:hypothetical protein
LPNVAVLWIGEIYEVRDWTDSRVFDRGGMPGV